MQVKELITLLTKALEILELYKDKTVSKMLEDIQQKVSGEKVSTGSLKERVEDGTANQSALHDLSSLKKEKLIEIARSLNLKVNSKETKSAIINLISNHYGFVKLNEKISQRNSIIGSQLEEKENL